MIKIGIIGAGNIAKKFSEAVNNSQLIDGELHAIASRSIEKAEIFKNQHNIKKAYGSYEELYKDKDIDLIYIATPHVFHYDQMMDALDYNKNILCEKPFTINAKLAEKVFKKAKEKNVFIMEAMWTRFLPVIQEVKKQVDNGIIGKIELLEADFCFNPNNPIEHRLYQLKLGGGALLDVGIYPITFANIFMSEPKNIESTVKMYKTDVDASETIEYQYDEGKAILRAAINEERPLLATIKGTKGKIVIEGLHETESAKVYDINNNLIKHIEIPHDVNGFEYEIKEAIDCIKAGKLESDNVSHEVTLSILKQMDQIRDSWNFYYPQEK
ncbi:MAG: Gfo/Idh/MocA family oxidoreductase [Tenericutes bacterium]|jgi:dihydrodiol dehydrogenase / D-xylose 1-dehydrogenase (NADP)|nr:Gfo/Idh/MocA family oxidoreductase [Mycoplasmatota bacterium]